MDDGFKLATYKQGLRFKYTGHIPELRAFVTLLIDGANVGDDNEGEANDSVVITNQAFEGGQASGALVLEPLVKLAAAIDVYNELDPDNAIEAPASSTFADFSQGMLET